MARLVAGVLMLAGVMAGGLGMGTAAADSVNFQNNGPDMELEVMRIAPKGASVKKGVSVLEASGFDCGWGKGKPFADYRRDDVDFAMCNYTASGVPIIRRWRVAIIFKGDKVQDVAARVNIVTE